MPYYFVHIRLKINTWNVHKQVLWFPCRIVWSPKWEWWLFHFRSHFLITHIIALVLFLWYNRLIKGLSPTWHALDSNIFVAINVFSLWTQPSIVEKVIATVQNIAFSFRITYFWHSMELKVCHLPNKVGVTTIYRKKSLEHWAHVWIKNSIKLLSWSLILWVLMKSTPSPSVFPSKKSLNFERLWLYSILWMWWKYCTSAKICVHKCHIKWSKVTTHGQCHIKKLCENWHILKHGN